MEFGSFMEFHTREDQSQTSAFEESFNHVSIAEELGLDMVLARRAGLLHDISKAINYDAGSDPASASAALVRKSGESTEVIAVIETHNQNMPSRSPMATLVEAANQICTFD